MLEGMVFAPRAVEAIARGKQAAEATGAMRAVLGGGERGTIGGLRPPADDVPSAPAPAGEAPPTLALRARLQRALTRGAGVLRSAESLAQTRAVLEEVAAAATTLPPARDSLEVGNLAAVGRALLRAATFRRESRGAHTRSDFPRTEDDLRVRIVLDQRSS
ncbi:hypothetical protein B7486_64385 [cyanobacterium TDX16]|nr:hypothetical protein B7486_64385 [cyanobacterium TDX16]